ncbi:MAG TPA: choice-of-anchor B family protein [Longimicrobiales bacterium]|nr:choice-of-anchor B family protein [Longimicrobiales bacterium]
MKLSIWIGGLALFIAAPLAAQGFGTAVAVGDAEVLVGQALNERSPGHVYVYRKGRDGRWTQVQRLEASDATPGDRFGRFVSVHGNSALIGATVWNESRGAVYAFEKDGRGQWREVQRFTPSDVGPGEAFGRAAARDRDVAAVATWGHQGSRGAVYVLRRGRDGRWSQEAKLMAPDAVENQWFGQAIEIRDDMLIAGAPQMNGSRGAAYVFRRGPDGRWSHTTKLEVEGAPENYSFGNALLLAGDRLLVGAVGADTYTGKVHVYRPAEAGWEQERTLLPFDAGQYAQFGAALYGAGESAVWVASPGANAFQGRLYAYRGEAGDWTAVEKIGAEGLRQGAGFGSTADVTGTLAAIGVTGADFGVGAVQVMERSGAAWREAATLVGEVQGMEAIVGGRVACSGGKAADLFPCQDVELLAFLPVQDIGGGRGVEVNDVWGWTDPQSGREYAIVGRYDGTSFIDVTDATNPRYLGDLPMTEGSQPNVWRDIKVYRDHAFIVADGAGPHGIQVFDLTKLRSVRQPQTFTEDAHYDGIHSAHNIVIDTVAGYAFAVGSSGGGQTCGGGLHMVDIRTPRQPTFAGCFSDPETGRAGTGYSHDAQCVTYDGPDAEHRGKHICFGSNETALSIADVTDKRSPVALARSSYPSVQYSHQGWLTDDQRHFYMNDEGDETAGVVAGTRTLIWDVADLDDPVLVGEYIHDNPAIDHNLYVRGNLMYQSNYTSGLRILDISEPEAPRLVGYFDTVPWGEDEAVFDGSWSNYPFFQSGTLVVTSGKEGVFLLRKRPIIP